MRIQISSNKALFNSLETFKPFDDSGHENSNRQMYMIYLRSAPQFEYVKSSYNVDGKKI